MTKKIKVILTCFKQTSYEDYTHFFKSVEIEVPYSKGEEWHVCGEEYQEPYNDEVEECVKVQWMVIKSFLSILE